MLLRERSSIWQHKIFSVEFVKAALLGQVPATGNILNQQNGALTVVLNLINHATTNSVALKYWNTEEMADQFLILYQASKAHTEAFPDHRLPMRLSEINDDTLRLHYFAYYRLARAQDTEFKRLALLLKEKIERPAHGLSPSNTHLRIAKRRRSRVP